MFKVNGFIYFKNKREKLRIWRELQQEYNGNVEITFKDHIIEYACYVPRTFI